MFSHKGGAKTPLPIFHPHKKSFHECFRGGEKVKSAFSPLQKAGERFK